MTDPVMKYKSYAAHLLRYPNDTDTLVKLYALLSEDGYHANNRHYLVLAKRASEIEPDDPMVVLNLVAALERCGRYEEALTACMHCMKVSPKEAAPYVIRNIGICYRGLGDNLTAIKFYEAALELDPRTEWQRDRAISMMAGATMGTHSLVEALKAFEIRKQYAEEKFKTTGVLLGQRKLPDGIIQWHGEDLTGKSVVVYHEEGAGDFIQFCRFIPKLYELGVKDVRLTGPNPDLLEMISDNIAVQSIVPLKSFECDYVIGSMTLPWRTGIEYEHVNGAPYISAEPGNIPKRDELNVGLVWRGSPIYARDHLRSMPFETLTPLFELSGVAFNSLQIGPASREITHLGFDGFVADLQPFMKTWRQTARVIAALDAVVTVDTAVAHLAGAMGKPVVVMVTRGCDWRWNRNNDRTAWYSSARVIRQSKQDDWTPCIEYAKMYLKELLDGRRGQTFGANGASEPGKQSAAG